MTGKQTILESFLGTKCAGCGGTKRPRMSHCAGCYHSLPRKMQTELYRRFGEGYEAAYTASVEWLRARASESNHDDVQDATAGEK